MIRGILIIVIMLSRIAVNAQRQYIPKPLTSHEPTIYTNEYLGYTKDVKRATSVDSVSHAIEEYGFDRNGFQLYYIVKSGRHVDSMANIYNNGKLIRNEVYEDRILLDHRAYDYKGEKLVLFREFSGRKMFTRTSYTYKKEKLTKTYTKTLGINFYETYEYNDENYSLQRKKIGKRTFEITNVINTNKFKSIEIYDPEDLDFRYEKKIYRYDDNGLLVQFVDYQLNSEYQREIYTYDESGLRNIKQYRSGKLHSETFLDTQGYPIKVNFYYINGVYEYENSYNDKGDRIKVKFINDGKLVKVTKYDLEYW